MPRRRPSLEEGTEVITTIMFPKLTDMMTPEFLQEFQDTFSESFDISVAILDGEGKAITRPALSTDTSSLSKGGKAAKSRAVLAVKAIGSGRIEKARDTRGLLQLALPIGIQGLRVGVMLVADIPDAKTDTRHLRELARKLDTTPEDVRKQSGRRLDRAVAVLQFAANALAGICHEGWIIRRHMVELRTLQRVSQMLGSTRHLDELLKLIVRTVCDTLKVKACGVRLLEPSTGELVLMAVHGLSEEYLSKGPVLFKRSTIDQAAMDGEPVYIRDIGRDPRILYPAEMIREGIRSNLVIGLKVRDRAIGALRIYSGEKRYFHQSEIALAEAIANLSAIAIENAKLYEEAMEKDRLEHELGLAAQIQSHLLPSECPQPEGFDICAVNQPSRHVGGDFYDYVRTPGDDRLGIVIADVCGKSMGGALLMATARSAMRVQCEHCMTPGEIVTRVNRSLCRDTRPEEFVTFFFAKLDTTRRVLHYANAGHNRPLLYRGSETIPLEGSGMVCGVLVENTYVERDIQLESGDVLLLYTDGLDEARNPEDRFFGLERTGEVIRKHRGRPASEIIRKLCQAVHRFAAGRQQSDDLTLILIKVL
ncbi:MAG TPA: SpoIIE family protein phosphatase [Planctomycetota bacterium]|nr:SpoIIE family protein phosphatase [Planctomycetota bacterium]